MLAFFPFFPHGFNTFRKAGAFWFMAPTENFCDFTYFLLLSKRHETLRSGTCTEIFTRDFELKLRFQIFLRLCFMSNKFPNGAPAIFSFQHETGKFIAFCFYSFQVFCKNFLFRELLQIPKNVYRIMTFTFIALLKKKKCWTWVANGVFILSRVY